MTDRLAQLMHDARDAVVGDLARPAHHAVHQHDVLELSTVAGRGRRLANLTPLVAAAAVASLLAGTFLATSGTSGPSAPASVSVAAAPGHAARPVLYFRSSTTFAPGENALGINWEQWLDPTTGRYVVRWPDNGTIKTSTGICGQPVTSGLSARCPTGAGSWSAPTPAFLAKAPRDIAGLARQLHSAVVADVQAHVGNGSVTGSKAPSAADLNYLEFNFIGAVLRTGYVTPDLSGALRSVLAGLPGVKATHVKLVSGASGTSYSVPGIPKDLPLMDDVAFDGHGVYVGDGRGEFVFASGSAATVGGKPTLY